MLGPCWLQKNVRIVPGATVALTVVWANSVPCGCGELPQTLWP